MKPCHTHGGCSYIPSLTYQDGRLSDPSHGGQKLLYITLASFGFFFFFFFFFALLLLYCLYTEYTHANLGRRGMRVAVNNVAMVICPSALVIRSYIRTKRD